MLAELAADRFRNLAPLRWRPGAGSHLLLGGNGAGKTSILEAMYLVATTRSFRTAQLADCCRHGSDSFRLAAEVEAAARVRLEVVWSAGQRTRAVNGHGTSLAEHLEVLPVVAWTAEQGELLTGAPEVRRRFLDRGVIGTRPAALATLTRYRRVLAQKRQLLQHGGSGLATWNELLATAAAELIALRRAYVAQLGEAFRTVLGEAGLAFPKVELRYRPSPRRGNGGAEDILAALERAEPRERQRRMPLLGPHRDDLVIAWADHQLRRVASAGERKAVGLCLLGAHGRVLAELGHAPLYLLDDADTELAPTTLEAVWRIFAGAGQLFATSNRDDVWRGVGFDRRWSVSAGGVS
ncbi:MAG: DNA replication and repair protein RecF [Acidobacteria bacterium]|nr:DNA replication and repair protein RecF [Acidobacteriota bacterium]